MHAQDWRATALGEPAGWPPSLRAALSICLGSGFPAAICWGPTFTLLYNDAWSAMLGTYDAGPLGRTASEVWPEMWEAIGESFERVLSHGETTSAVDRLLPMRRDGRTEECYFDFTLSPIRGDDGRIEGVFTIMVETTTRVIAERRARADAVAELDRAKAAFLTRLFAGDAGALIGSVATDEGTALAAGDVAGARPRVLVADADADMREYVRRLLEPRYEVDVVSDVAGALDAVADQRPDLIVVSAALAADGVRLVDRIHADERTARIPVLTLAGEFDGASRADAPPPGGTEYPVNPFTPGELLARVDAAIGLARLRRANEARVTEMNRRLTEQLAEFETLLDVLPVGIGIARDPECREIRVNSAFARVLGLQTHANASKTAPPGERPDNFHCVDDQGRVVPDTELPMQVAAARGENVDGVELNIVHADGRVYRLLEYAAPLFDEHGKPRGSVGAFVDVTERSRIERQREELLERERTAREEMDRLRQAAEAASRAKDEFFAMLGHELRNPLAPIMTALHLMRLRGGKQLERERDVIERQVAHLTRLVDDLLDVSRIARGKVELKKEAIQVAEVVTKAIEQTSPLLEQRTHVLELEMPRTDLLVEADPTRLAQVISNLLTNAAKYTEAGGRITVAVRREGEEVVVSVRDTGMGISADMLPRVFDLFAQETQAVDRAQGGLGLGLTIVRNLVNLHGGRVAVFSEGPGRGSQFDVRLPALSAADRPAGETGPVADPAHDTHQLRVLVVDDNPDAAEMLVEVLCSFGHNARAAHDGPAALRLCREFKADVALLDIGLPVMDGYELALRIRELPGLADVRLVAVTGYGQDSDRERSRRAGFHHHLVKPIDIEIIDAVIRGNPARS